MKLLILSASLFVIPMMGAAKEYTLGDLVIDHPVAGATMQSAMTGAGYFTITNTGAEADTLIEISADFPRVMMHDTKTEDGIATMFHMEEGVVIPAGGTITFAQGGKHVMFMGLNGDPFEIGEDIPATFTFEVAGAVKVSFQVEDMTISQDH